VSRQRRILWTAALLVSLWSCSQRRREGGLNVLLITIDTLRFDALSASVTPRMERLGQTGVRFEDARAHNVVTLPSHANILSGRYPLDHGVRDNSGYRFPADQETLATLLKAHGYRTAAFVSAFPLDARFGLDRGFDVYEDSFADASPRPAFQVQERSGRETAELAARWIATKSDNSPWFCWLHLYEPHAPYAPPDTFAATFRNDPYRGEVAAVDAALAPLLDPILRSGEDGGTLVVLTSDHGESLGEHGERAHGIFAYEATLKVPMILYEPRLFRPRVVSDPVRHVDLLPTILDALEIPLPGNLRGRSLLPLAAGAPLDAEAPTYFEALSGSLNRGWAPLHGVLRGGMKYIDLPVPEIYDLKRDPGEIRNLAGEVRHDDLRKLLSELLSSDAGSAREKESAETRERLRSLGYVSGAAGTEASPSTEEDDPKRLMAIDEMLHDVVDLHAAGDLESALSKCRELVRLRPGMQVSWLHLAQLERESGNLEEAVAALEKAVALNAEDAEAVSLLGAYLTQAGRADEAFAFLEPYMEDPEPDTRILSSAGLALARLQRFENSLAVFARARQQDPSSASLWVETGTVQVMAGDREGARQAFESALSIHESLPRAHLSLGVLALERGRPDEAASHWQRAVASDPREYRNLLGLGLSQWRAGNVDLARHYLEFFSRSAPPELYRNDIAQVRSLLSQPVR
jgi:arylsulfatase A-like enzyme/Flp pilus assembly protein TadD